MLRAEELFGNRMLRTEEQFGIRMLRGREMTRLGYETGHSDPVVAID